MMNKDRKIIGVKQGTAAKLKRVCAKANCGEAFECEGECGVTGAIKNKEACYCPKHAHEAAERHANLNYYCTSRLFK